MNIEDQVAVLFAKANRVPSLDLLDPIEPMDIDSLRDRSDRSRAMTDLDTAETKEYMKRQPARLSAALAIGAVAVIALLMVLGRQAGVASPEEVADAYMEARRALDIETASALFAEDATVSEDGFDVSEMPALFDSYQRTGWDWVPGQCTQADDQPHRPILVTCPYQFENNMSRAIDLEPVSGEITIFVSGGEITSLTSVIRVSQFGAPMQDSSTG